MQLIVQKLHVRSRHVRHARAVRRRRDLPRSCRRTSTTASSRRARPSARASPTVPARSNVFHRLVDGRPPTTTSIARESRARGRRHPSTRPCARAVARAVVERANAGRRLTRCFRGRVSPRRARRHDERRARVERERNIGGMDQGDPVVGARARARAGVRARAAWREDDDALGVYGGDDATNASLGEARWGVRTAGRVRERSCRCVNVDRARGRSVGGRERDARARPPHSRLNRRRFARD